MEVLLLTFQILKVDFLRGADNGATVDPDAGTRVPLGSGVANGVGSLQNNSLGSHEHFVANGGTRNSSATTGRIGYIGTTGTDFNLSSNNTTAIPDRGPTSPVGGSESRPSNCSVNYIIKL
jgi:hypothetical protein